MYNFITNNDFIDSAKAYISFEGYRCGLTSFDEIMRIDKQTITTLVATPSSGKSTFTNFYGYRMGVTNGWKTLYLATETPKNDQAKKLSTLYGSYQQASEHSIILEGALNDCEELLQAIKAAKQQFNIDMCIIDNFTMIQRLIQGEVNTTNIGKVIAMLKQAAIDTDTAIILVAHPTKLNEGQKVTAYSVNGSANFFNMSDYMFSIEITDCKQKETAINVLKLRDDAKGVMNGKCTLKYDDITRKYSDIDSPEDSQHDTPKDINYDIAREVMKEIEEEAKQPAGTTKAATQQTAVQPASKEVKKEKQQEAKEEKQQAAKEEAKQEEKQEEKQAQRITPDFIHNTKVSIMERHNILKTSSLYNAIIMGKEHKKEIEAVRRIDRQANESEYKKAKDNILSFIPSCVCKGKTGKAENVEHVNNLIAIDLDAKDNENITIEEMRKKINSLPYVMYSSLSIGGKGMYALIPILESNKNDFKAVFNALNEDFIKLGLKLDGSCVNVNRERYMSIDKAEYWNKQCEIYTKKINIPTQAHDTHKRVESSAETTLTEKDKEKVDLMIEDIKANKIQLSKKHKDTLGLANCLANILGEKGRDLLHIIRSQREGYDENKTDKNFDYALDHLDDNERYGLGFLISKYKEAKQGQTQVN
ncbi:AAA family ATPase [Prevotella jejuni]|uniref:AAA family ATPase n=1 Tax=Prevotella jejuni TaxID=1177574 RepID=UPI00352F5DAD